jgi:hypothetical protein
MTARKKANDKKIKKMPIEQKAKVAFKKAVAKAIATHRSQGRSIAVWDKGKINTILPNKNNG